MTAHVLARSDTGFVLEHAREMVRVIKAEHVCRFADAAAAHQDVFCQTDDVRLYILFGGSTCGLLHQVSEVTC